MHDILNAEVRTPMLEFILCSFARAPFARFHGDLRRCHALRSLRMEVEIFWELPRHQKFWCREMIHQKKTANSNQDPITTHNQPLSKEQIQRDQPKLGSV